MFSGLRVEDWEALFRFAPVGLVFSDSQGVLRTANVRFCTLVEYADVELRGISVQSLTHPADAAAEQEMVTKLLGDAINSFDMLKRFLTKSGRSVWCRIHVTKVQTESRGVQIVTTVIPLVNGERVRVESCGDGNVTLRPTVSLKDVLVDNWKVIASALATLVVAHATVLSYYFIQTDQQRSRTSQLEAQVKILESELRVRQEPTAPP